MKKIIGLLLLMIAFTACEGPMGPPGPPGPAGGNGDSMLEGWKYRTFTVKSEDWQLVDGPEPFYVYEFQWDELTEYVYKKGVVMGNVYTLVGDVETLTPLPFVLHRQDSKGTFWTETYTFDYNPGYVAFYATFSDFFVDQRPGDMDFRVSILW